NIFLHAASAVLLWRLLLLLELPGAWLAAAVFALHPVHVESVAWITERKNTLSLLFYLAAAFCFLKRELVPQSRGNWLLYFASLGCFLAALLCKTVTATLPCALLVVLWWKQGTLSLRQIAWAVPMLIMAVPLGMHTAHLERDHVGAVGPEWSFSLAERCLIAGRAVWFYASKLVFPYPLTFIYPRWEIDERDWRQYLFPVAACAFVAVLFVLRKRIGRGPLTAALFFGGTLFPALGFFNVYPMKYSFVADHFQYAASIGLIVLFVATGAGVVARYGMTGTGHLLAFALLGVLAILTWRQCLIYSDLETLWRDTLAKNPACKMAYINLGTWLRSEGQLPEAALAFAGAVKLRPSDPDGYIGLAMTHAALQDLDQAERILRETILLDPDYAMTYGNLADVMDRKERLDDAAKLFQQALT
ncbi:MAG: tetratricopeptide repeat protein, partial [Pirellulaceae bacterium]